MSTRSPSGDVVAVDRIDDLGDRRALAGEPGLLDLERRRHQDPAVGRDLVAGLEADDVAGHQLLGRDLDAAGRRAGRCAVMISIWRSAATLSAALPSWCRPITALSTVRPRTTSPVETSWRATMLTTAAPTSTSCIRSRYWRRNAFQAGSFGLLGELVRPVPLPPLGDLGRAQADGRVDVEPPADLVARTGGTSRPGRRPVWRALSSRPSRASCELAREVVERRARLRLLLRDEVDPVRRRGSGGTRPPPRRPRWAGTWSTARAAACRPGRATARPRAGGRSRPA